MKGKKSLMKNLYLVNILVSLFVVAVCVNNPIPSWAAEHDSNPATPIELSLNSMFPAGTAQHQHLERWAEKIKTDSNGRLIIRIYPGAILSPVPKIYDATGKGISDLGYGFKYTRAEQFDPIDGFMAGTPGIQTTHRIYKDLWDGNIFNYRAEFKKAKVLWFGYTGPSRLHTVKPVRTLGDLKGMQIRTSGRAGATILPALGSGAVAIPTSELAIALQKGILQGTVSPDDQLKTFRLADVLPYTTEISLWQPSPNFMVMNIDKYNSLPSDLQKVIDDSLPWAEKDCLKMWEGTDRAGRDYANSLGHEFISLSPEEREKWMAAIEGAQDEIAIEIDRKGYPGTKVLQFIRERITRYSD